MRYLCIGLAALAAALTACGGNDAGPVALQPPTFDATGTWIAQVSASFSNPTGSEELDGAAQVQVTQTGNTVTVAVVGDPVVYTGTVSGADYSVGATLPETDGSTDETIAFTLASADAGSGTLRWLFTGVGGPIAGGSDLAIARAVSPQFDMTGTWDFTLSGSFSNPAGSEEPNGTVGVPVVQTGSTVQLTLDGAARTGFVSGADYFVEYDMPGGGGADVCVFVAFSLSSATAGTGMRQWRSENGVVITGGGNLALAKQ